MTQKIVQHEFTGLTTPYVSYDSTKTTLGTLMCQNTGTTSLDKWVGPMPVGFLKIRETGASGTAATDFVPNYPFAIQISDSIDWVFLASLDTASATRKVGLVVYNRDTQTFDFRGFVAMTMPSGGTHTITSFRVIRHLYTTGSVAVNGTAVTGTDTSWKTAGYAVGARIGFGNTNPNLITDWYEISAMSADNSITLTKNAGSIAGGTAFVIEELRVVLSTVATPATSGGLFLTKGLNFGTFGAATLIPAATNTDNIRAVYWLKDATTVTNTISSGMGLDVDYTDASHFCYVLNNNTATTLSVFKYDLRKSLTVSSGASTDAFIYKTGVSGTLPTLLTANSSRLGTLNHGVAAGEKSIFFCATRIYRIPVSMIKSNETNFISDSMAEIPPGYAASIALQTPTTIDISEYLDRLVMFSATPSRAYLTKYNIENFPIDHIFGCFTGQIDASTTWPGYTTPHWNTAFGASSGYVLRGMAYILRTGATAIQTGLYAIPVGADWNYASVVNQRVICPALDTPNAESLTRLYVNCDKIIGSDLLGIVPEPFRMFVRTTGITNNTGEWTRVEAGDLSKIVPGEQIQVMFEFRVMGLACVPARIHSIGVVYEIPSTDTHFQPSLKFAEKIPRFTWRFSTAFGTSVPALRVRIYDADTGSLLSDDATSNPTGLFEKTVDGGTTWTSWNTTDKTNETTYVRYTYRPGTTTIIRSRLKAILSLEQ